MPDSSGQGAFGFHDSDHSQTGGRAVKGHLRNMHQRLRVLLSFSAHRHDHRLIDRLLANSADNRVGKPQQRIIDIENLQKSLRQVHP